MAKAKTKTSGLFFHIASILLTLVAVIFLFLIIQMNVPIPRESHPHSSEVAFRAWLLKIDTSHSKLHPVKPDPPPTIRLTTGSDSTPDTPQPDAGTSTTPSETASGSGGVRSNIPILGFGPWGWCEWKDIGSWRPVWHPYGDHDSDDGYDLSGVHKPDDPLAMCVNKAFWEIPEDVPFDSYVHSLTLPYSLRHSLSIASFFLVFALVGAVLYLLVLLVAIADPPFEVQKTNAKLPLVKANGLSTGTYASARLRHRGWAIFNMICLWAETIPTFVVINVAIHRINQSETAFHANFAMGAIMLVLAFVFLHVSYLLNIFGGVYVNYRVPEQPKPKPKPK